MAQQDSGNDLGTKRALESVRRSSIDFLDALLQPDTFEVMLNSDGQLWIEKVGQPMKILCEFSQTKADELIRYVAGYHQKTITADSPLLECAYPLDGSRFTAQVPPVVERPTFAIRRKAISIYTLEQYVDSGTLEPHHRDYLVDCIKNHRNIVVVGGTGTGKTTFVNALVEKISSICPLERLILIEDTPELQCASRNHVFYRTSPDVDMSRLVRVALRMRPDRVLVGEVRGAEALDLLTIWNTGHEGGVATLHANNALAGLNRLKMMISQNQRAPSPIEPLLGEVVHVIVFIVRTPTGRKVKEILEVSGYSNGSYQTKNV